MRSFRCAISRYSALWKPPTDCCFVVLTTKVSAQRNQVEITESNVRRFERLLSRADPGTEFILSTDVEISSTLSITADRITLRGSSPEVRPVIQCRTENEVGFQIRYIPDDAGVRKTCVFPVLME